MSDESATIFKSCCPMVVSTIALTLTRRCIPNENVKNINNMGITNFSGRTPGCLRKVGKCQNWVCKIMFGFLLDILATQILLFIQCYREFWLCSFKGTTNLGGRNRFRRIDDLGHCGDLIVISLLCFLLCLYC